MFDIFRRKTESLGVALFRGATPHPLNPPDLEIRGLAVKTVAARADAHWSVDLEHPEWGRAEVDCLRNPPRPPADLLELDPKLGPADVAALADCGVAIAVRCESRVGNVLRDRKFLLRFLDVLLGRDGVAAVDTQAGPFYWTREALEDELAHDADLDVESIYTIHAVGDDEAISWFHTHGLGELGRFDFDILSPGAEFMEACGWFTRALAFLILEGAVDPGERNVVVGRPLPGLALVPVADFMARAAPNWRVLREDPDDVHSDRRVVLCESGERGLLGRFFGRGGPEPSRLFRRAFPEDVVFHFSHDASALMAARARATWPVLQLMAEEFEGLEFPVLVKIGYRTEGGGEMEREHLWFQGHELRSDSVDATCVNRPWAVPHLSEGDRRIHSIEGLSDWTVLTPFGPITPHAFHARRLVREHRSEIEEHLRQAPDGR